MTIPVISNEVRSFSSPIFKGGHGEHGGSDYFLEFLRVLRGEIVPLE